MATTVHNDNGEKAAYEIVEHQAKKLQRQKLRTFTHVEPLTTTTSNSCTALPPSTIECLQAPFASSKWKQETSNSSARDSKSLRRHRRSQEHHSSVKGDIHSNCGGKGRIRANQSRWQYVGPQKWDPPRFLKDLTPCIWCDNPMSCNLPRSTVATEISRTTHHV